MSPSEEHDTVFMKPTLLADDRYKICGKINITHLLLEFTKKQKIYFKNRIKQLNKQSSF